MTTRRVASSCGQLHLTIEGEPVDEVFCLEFVSSVARQAFMNGLALKHIKDSPDLMTMSIPSACPKSLYQMTRWLINHRVI